MLRHSVERICTMCFRFEIVIRYILQKLVTCFTWASQLVGAGAASGRIYQNDTVKLSKARSLKALMPLADAVDLRVQEILDPNG